MGVGESMFPHDIYKRALFFMYASATTLFRPLVTEELQVQGIEKLENKINNEKGALWLGKHDGKMDALNLPPLWFQFPGLPSFRGVSRTDYIKIAAHPRASKYLSSALSWVMKQTIFYEVHRIKMLKDLTISEVEPLRAQNRTTIQQLRPLYLQGIHIAIMPEGTTKTDGRISEIKNGAYDLYRPEVLCVPFGNTYDSMSASHNIFGGPRDLVFVNFGMPFYYKPVPRQEYEPEAQYQRRDKTQFCQKIRNCFMNLNTITTAQLAGEYLLAIAKQGERKCTAYDVEKVISQRVDALRQIGSIIIDRALLDNFSREKRVRYFYESLQENGYVGRDGIICAEKIFLTPESKEMYKKQNPLRYMANRLIGIAEERPQIKEVLDNTL